jgi:hypothetical protein
MPLDLTSKRAHHAITRLHHTMDDATWHASGPRSKLLGLQGSAYTLFFIYA